ncbi:MAG: histidine kinase dimerization/phospho-acceptor domain-containing protein, partial [Planctomycetota bacterium]
MPARTTTTVPGASPEAADEQPSPSASGRRLTLLYIFALSTVAVLSVGAQLLIQRQLHTGEGDSRVINFAGRQRMLSQRLAKSALRLKSVDADGRTESLAELKETVDLWTRTHDGLLQGDAELRLPGGNSPAVTELFAVIEPDYLAMAAAARTLLTGDAGSPPDREAIATIQRHENRFLTGMDEIVSQYVLEAEHRVERLSRLELAILALTLLVLLAEGVLIFRPAVRRIEQAVSRLETVSDRLRRAKDEAEHGNAAKTRFLANVSHELRTPMTAVLGMTELAQETQDDEERTGYLKIVEEAGESLLSLLNDLIDTARIDAGELELVVAPFDPQEVVERVSRMMRFAGREKGLELVVEKPPQRLPMLLGDARRLEQILLNLIGNAIK